MLRRRTTHRVLCCSPHRKPRSAAPRAGTARYFLGGEIRFLFNYFSLKQLVSRWGDSGKLVSPAVLLMLRVGLRGKAGCGAPLRSPDSLNLPFLAKSSVRGSPPRPCSRRGGEGLSFVSRRACGRLGRGGTCSRGSAAVHCPCLSSARSSAVGWRRRVPGHSSGAASAWAPRLGIAASGF